MQSEQTPSEQAETKIYYFYFPNCPSCIKAKPYIEELAKIAEVELCNVKSLNCSKESLQVMKEIELNAVPTLVVKSSETKVFVGLKEIAELCSSSVETNCTYCCHEGD
jgi:thiol-disulfide isomerase/thioredoxin